MAGSGDFVPMFGAAPSAPQGDFALDVTLEGQILKATGSTLRSVGIPPGELAGAYLSDLAAPSDRMLLLELLYRIMESGGASDFSIRLKSADDSIYNYSLSGSPGKGGEEDLQVSFRRLDIAADAGEAVESLDSPLQHAEIFLNTVQGYLTGDEHPGDHNLTLVDVGDVDAAMRGGAISDAQAGEYVSSVEASLRAWSIGGNTVGVMGNGKYGVVHEASVNSSAIEGRVSSLAEKVDPGGETLKTQATTISLDDDDLSQEALSDALKYTLDKFSEEGIEAVQGKSIGENYQALQAKLEESRRQFAQALTDGRLRFFFDTVVHLGDRSVDHVATDPRLEIDGAVVEPWSVIDFTSEAALIAQFDLAQCRLATSLLKRPGATAVGRGIAVTISCRSLAFSDVFDAMLAVSAGDSSRLVILRLMDIDPTVADQPVQLEQLHAAGYALCLPGFAVGGAGMQQLRALPLDYVALQRSYVSDADTIEENLPVLTAVAEMCGTKGIRIVFEGVDEPGVAELLSNASEALAQGMQFSVGIDQDEFLRPAD